MENLIEPQDSHEKEIMNNQFNYIELHESNNINDITLEFKSLLKTFSKGQIISSADFKLEDTMAAIELNHPKMDLHYHNETISTYKTLLKQNKIKPMASLTLEDTLILIDELFQREVSWMYGGSIHQNIFSLIYLSDNTYKNDNSNSNNYQEPIFHYYLNSSFHMFYLIYINVVECTSLRDEDLSFIFYPNVHYLKRDNCLNELKQCEAIIKKQLTSENKKVCNQLLNRIKIRKELISIFRDQLERKSKSRYDDLIINVNNIKAELPSFNFSLSNELNKDNKQLDISLYFNENISRLLPCLASNKKSTIYSSEVTLAKFTNLINDLNTISVIYEFRDFFQLNQSLDNLNKTTPSFIIRIILDLNLFPANENKLFDSIDYPHLVIENFQTLKINFISEDLETLDYIVATHKDLLKRKLKNASRQIREASEIIKNLTLAAIEGHKRESQLTNNSKITSTILTNYLLKEILNEMLSIVFINFDLELFKPYELDYVFYICEAIVNQLSMHNMIIVTRFAEKVLKEENIAESSLKKKMTPTQKMLIDEIYLNNAMKQTFNSMKVLMYHIIKHRLIKMPSTLTEEQDCLRIKNRFPYFKICSMFMSVSYQNFKEDIKKELSKENYLDLANENMKVGVQYLKELRAADKKLRDSFHYSNDYLNNFSKSIICNMLLISKIKKITLEGIEKRKLQLMIINKSKYDTFLPVLEIQDIQK